MELTVSGIVLRDTLYGENDKILTFLTGELGKISVYARGVKSINSKNSPAVQLLCYSSFELHEKNGRYLLTGAEALDSHYAIRSDLDRFALACYFAEVADTVCTENSDESEMLRLLLNCLYAAEHGISPLLKIKAAFEMQCMILSGFMPDLEECAECGKPAVDSTDKFGRYLFSYSEGAFLCPACLAQRARKDAIPLRPETVETLRGMLRYRQNQCLRFSVCPETAYELYGVCEAYLSRQTGKHYKTADFFHSTYDPSAEQKKGVKQNP